MGTALYLRTANRYRWVLISRRLDGYAAIERELSEAGIAVVKTSIPHPRLFTTAGRNKYPGPGRAIAPCTLVTGDKRARAPK